MNDDHERAAHVLIIMAVVVITLCLCMSAIGGAQQGPTQLHAAGGGHAPRPGKPGTVYERECTAMLPRRTAEPSPRGAANERADAPARSAIRLRLSKADRVLAARIAANEDSRPMRAHPSGTAGEPTTDTLAILQVVHDFAAWRGISHGRALRLLAPHVSGQREPKRRRHAVIGALPASGRDLPAGWRPELDGAWRAHSPHWSRFRARVGELALRGFHAPCARAVVAWGNESDDPIAESRGLERVACGETANRFWGLP